MSVDLRSSIICINYNMGGTGVVCVSVLNLSVSYLHCGLYDAATHDICEGTSLPSLQSYHIHGFPGLKEENTERGWIFGPMEKPILKQSIFTETHLHSPVGCQGNS